jgi:hypothetical protein
LKATEITDELAKVEAELAEKQGKAKKLSKVIGVEIVESYYPDWDRDVAMTVCVLSARNAYKAGVREEDIVLSLNGTAVDTLPEFRTQMDAVNAGDVIELEIVRNMVNYRKLTALRAKRNKGRKPVAKNKKKEKQAVMDDEKEKVFVFKIEVDPLVITPREARQLHARIDALRKERALLLGRQVFLATRKKAEVLEAKKRAARLEEENKHNNRRGRRQRNRGQSTAATPKSARRSKDPSQQRGGKGKSTTGNRTARTAKRGRTGKKQEAVAAAAAASSEQQAEQKQPTKEQIDAAWEAHHDDSRKLDYYYNTVTQESTWEVPPATWEEHFDSATKEPYYYNPLTDVTQWDSPFENLRKKRKKKGKKKSSASSRKR